jgi:hypothetical protein
VNEQRQKIVALGLMAGLGLLALGDDPQDQAVDLNSSIMAAMA